MSGSPRRTVEVLTMEARRVRYLDERVNFGGEIVSRGRAIAEMQADGIPPRGIDAWMMGARTMQREDVLMMATAECAAITVSTKGASVLSVESKDGSWWITRQYDPPARPDEDDLADGGYRVERRPDRRCIAGYYGFGAIPAHVRASALGLDPLGLPRLDPEAVVRLAREATGDQALRAL